jgi:hypothetical protein
MSSHLPCFAEDKRADRVGKRYLGHHVEQGIYRRAKILTAKLGWTMDALLRFALSKRPKSLNE